MIVKGSAVIAAVAAVISALRGSFWLLPLYFIGWFLAFFLTGVLWLVLICALVDTKKPQETDNKFYRYWMHHGIDLLMQLFLVRLKTRGLENIPTDGRFLLVCNHQNMADPGILLHCFPRSELTFISKQENRRIPIISKFMHMIRCPLIDRDNDRQALRAILDSIRMLKADEVSVAVFPEGYTSKDGKLHRFRNGVFKIAQKANVPIVVCTIRGSGALFHNIKRLKSTPMELHLVGAIPARELAGLHTNEIGDRVYEMMIADLGEEFRCAEF